MPKQQSVGHGGAKKYGGKEVKGRRYREHKTREKNKLKKILKSNGHKAAVAYARIHGLQEPKSKSKEKGD